MDKSTNVPPFVAAIVSQTNEANLQRERAYHARVAGLHEQLMALDLRIAHLDEEAIKAKANWIAATENMGHATHKPYTSKWLFGLVGALIFGGEVVLASTTFEGLPLDDSERILAAIAVTGIGFITAKGVASQYRAYHYLSEGTTKRQCALSMVVGVLFLLIMLIGQGVARFAFSDAAVAAGGPTISTSSVIGLTLVQLSLYCLQGVAFFYMLNVNPLAERARVNFQHAEKKSHALRQKQLPIAKRFNKEVARFKADFNAAIENAKHLISGYLRSIYALKKGSLLSVHAIHLSDNMFRPVSSSVKPAFYIKENGGINIDSGTTATIDSGTGSSAAGTVH